MTHAGRVGSAERSTSIEQRIAAAFEPLTGIIEALVESGNKRRDGGFTQNPDGWRCRMVRSIDFEVVRRLQGIVPSVRTSPEYDTVFDGATWCSVEGPGAHPR